MADIASLAAPAAAFFVLAAAPGSATLSVVAAAMSSGRRAALALSLGLSLTLAGWGALAAAGLGPLLTASAPLLFALKIAGAVVLFALAYGAAKSALAAPSPAADEVKPRGAFNWFLRGAALNGLNPKALVAWGAVFLFGADPGGGVWAIWAACAALGLAIYVGYSLLFSLPPMRDAYAKMRRIADGIVAAVFGAAALRLLFWRVDAP